MLLSWWVANQWMFGCRVKWKWMREVIDTQTVHKIDRYQRRTLVFEAPHVTVGEQVLPYEDPHPSKWKSPSFDCWYLSEPVKTGLLHLWHAFSMRSSQDEMSRGCMTVICRLQTRPDDFGSSQRQRTQSTCRSIHVAKVSSLTFSHVLSALSSLITRKVRLGATCHVHGVCSSSSVQFIFAWVRLTLTLLCYDLLHGRPIEIKWVSFELDLLIWCGRSLQQISEEITSQTTPEQLHISRIIAEPKVPIIGECCYRKGYLSHYHRYRLSGEEVSG